MRAGPPGRWHLAVLIARRRHPRPALRGRDVRRGWPPEAQAPRSYPSPLLALGLASIGVSAAPVRPNPNAALVREDGPSSGARLGAGPLELGEGDALTVVGDGSAAAQAPGRGMLVEVGAQQHGL